MKIDEINLRDYKLIAFDIDGTLIGTDHVIHPFTKQTLISIRFIQHQKLQSAHYLQR